MLIEGYASVFLEADMMGDRMRPGAFARSLSRYRGVPMLLRHKQGAVSGVWTDLRETGRGLSVRGLIEPDRPHGQRALDAIRNGLSGLSIGFHARRWRIRPDGGRDLIDVDLVEISLVDEPMAPSAGFEVIGAARAA